MAIYNLNRDRYFTETFTYSPSRTTHSKNPDGRKTKPHPNLLKAIFLLGAISLSITILSQFITNENVHSSSPVQTVTIQNGDSLWSLASKYAGDMDPWDWIFETKQLNHLSGSLLVAGHHLRIHDYSK